MAQNSNQPTFYKAHRRDPQEEQQDTRRSSIVSAASSIPTFVSSERKRSLAELRTADKVSFFGRLKTFMKALAYEGIKLELPFLVLDHLAINELNFKQLIFRERSCASNGRDVKDDGLNLFKLRAMDIDAKEGLPNEEWMVILNCDEPEGNHAIYKKLNQERAYKTTVSAYAFDIPGCLDPDGCMSFKPLDLDLLRSTDRNVMCSPCLVDYKDMYRTRARERNENEKASIGYPRDEYRGNVTLPAYFESRPTTPQRLCSIHNLGYGSNMSEPTTSGYNIGRRVISDTTNSPSKKLSTQAPNNRPRKVVIEQVPIVKKTPQTKTRGSKENRSTLYDDEHGRGPQYLTRPDVFERLGPVLMGEKEWVRRNVRGIKPRPIMIIEPNTG